MNANGASGARKAGPLVWLANGFGLGLSPVASGTVGSLWGIPIVWGMCYLPGLVWQVAVAILLVILAVPICDAGERYYVKKDDGRIVADEYLIFPLCMLGLPFTPWVVVMAFLSARFFDIVKLAPADQLQRLRGGVGIVVDDVAAAIYSLAANHLAFYLVTEYVLGGS